MQRQIGDFTFDKDLIIKNCRLIAEKIGLCEYDCDMAWVIGLLHDFARFGQAVRTHSFIDNEKFDHARLGARLLFNYMGSAAALLDGSAECIIFRPIKICADYNHDLRILFIFVYNGCYEIEGGEMYSYEME